MTKRKKKVVVMIALSVVAAVLLAVRLGPLLLGGPIASPPPKNKNTKKKREKTSAPPPTSAAAAPGDAGEPSAGEAAHGRIDLSGARQRTTVYRHEGLRDPFGPARFERTPQRSSLAALGLRLTGTVRIGAQRLAIINGKVYAEGDEVAEGVRVHPIESQAATLVSGDHHLRLEVPTDTPELRGP
jgi:hypothetical protein